MTPRHPETGQFRSPTDVERRDAAAQAHGRAVRELIDSNQANKAHAAASLGLGLPSNVVRQMRADGMTQTTVSPHAIGGNLTIA